MINFLLAPFIAIGLMLGSLFTTPVEQPLGASADVPTTIAFFETTLASAISSTATTFTLTSATDKDGTTLASSTYAFVIDEGSSNEEIVLADCTGTACTNVERGISVRTGNTEVTALKKSHRRGASVKMTDAPLLPLVARILRGEGTVDFTPTAGGNLATKDYVDDLALGTTTVAASETDDGLVEFATQVEMSSSTAIGGSGSYLALKSQYATSSCQVAGRYIPITDPLTGKIAKSCLTGPTYTFLNTKGTSTYSVPEGVNLIKVTVIGGGGNGGMGTPGSPGLAGTGGGAGGTAIKWYDVTATRTLQYHVGTSTEYSWFGGTYSSPTITANGGTSGATAVTGVGGYGGAGGTATGGDINITGQNGGTVASTTLSSDGGSTLFGFGGRGGAGETGTGISVGSSATGCGAGGGGSTDGTSAGVGPGNGALGCILIEY